MVQIIVMQLSTNKRQLPLQPNEISKSDDTFHIVTLRYAVTFRYCSTQTQDVRLQCLENGRFVTDLK
jgi:hypothetical protein